MMENVQNIALAKIFVFCVFVCSLRALNEVALRAVEYRKYGSEFCIGCDGL